MTGPEALANLDDVVSVHLDAFPGFFMTQLGPRFLRAYYRGVVEFQGGILLTEEAESQCSGFVGGFVDPAAFYRELRRRRVRLALAACAGIAARPRRLLTLLADYRRVGGAARQVSEATTAELSSLAVRPSAAGKGVGSHLVRAFIVAARDRGAESVTLTTDAEANEAVNAFYLRMGFTCARTFEARRGRILNEYLLRISEG